jgi:leader peptidase (prepilin peptidase)/N-methyltransferase
MGPDLELLELGELALGPFDAPVFPIFAALLGLIIGSFANVCIHRLPLGRSVVRPSSACPGCGRAIAWYDNIPLLSYLLLLGRCRGCGARISPRYPLVEAANGALYLALAWRLGATLETAVLMLFVTGLLVLTLIDLDHQLLPDVITLPGIALGILASLMVPGWPVRPLAAVLSAAFGYLALFAVASAYQKARGVEGLGRGDWKMVAMLGAFLGWEKMLLTVFVASLAGTLVGLALMGLRGRSSQHALPLGTFLGAAALLVLFTGEPVIAWYRGMFDV